MTAGMAIAASLGMAAMVADLRRRPVPDWLAAAGVAGGMARSAWDGPHGIGIAATGAIVGFLILLPFRRRGALGSGDFKLMAAYGALLGPTGILLAGVFAAAIGGLSAAGKLLLNPRTAAIPYARAIVLGAWVSLLGGGL
jgi:prepilin signal peptidase PulO-like enzyme (type II secretory pathway)